MKHARQTVGLVALLGWAAVQLAACGGTHIPNTDVDDTPENRAIIVFCEKYRKAVERRDVAALLSMASPKYYDDGGNIDPEDDIDFAGLEEYLSDKLEDTKFGEASGIRYEIRYRRVTEERDMVFVDYTYSASFRVTDPGSDYEKWRSTVQENRLELVPDGDSFKIVAGM